MAAISSPSLPAASLPASSSPAACVQIRPARLCFEVKDVAQVAAKVNGAAQYVFKVAFAPTANAAVPATDSIEVEIPLHASSYKEALVILQAYGQSLRNKTPVEVREMIKNLTYSAVLIDGDDVKFREYDSKTHRFKKAHVTQHIASAVDKELDQYAKILTSNNSPIGKDTTVGAPTITLERRGAVDPKVTLARRSSEPSIHPTVELTARHVPRRASEGTLPFVKESKEDVKKRFHAHLEKIKSDPRIVSNDVLNQFDELFGAGFGERIIEDTSNLAIDKLLYTIAQTRLWSKLASAEQKALNDALLAMNNASKTHLEQFMYMVDVAIDKEFA